jgi:hypothetical protein
MSRYNLSRAGAETCFQLMGEDSQRVFNGCSVGVLVLFTPSRVKVYSSVNRVHSCALWHVLDANDGNLTAEYSSSVQDIGSLVHCKDADPLIYHFPDSRLKDTKARRYSTRRVRCTACCTLSRIDWGVCVPVWKWMWWLRHTHLIASS